MRVPLHVGKAYPGEERLFAFVSLMVRSLEYRVYGQVVAIVDSGSPRTVIAPKDAIKLNVPFKILPLSSPKELRVAGVILPAYCLKDVLIGLIDENRTLIRIKMSEMTVLNRPQQFRGEINHIPSIVGTDFLEDNKLAFHFDPYNKVAHLQD